MPSGVSYVLENRNLLSRVFPEFLGSYPVRPIKDYPTLLLETLRFVAPRRGQNPVVVVLSPGIHNSAYFEHSFLAREMGVPLVEGRDLLVEGNHLFMQSELNPTIYGATGATADGAPASPATPQPRLTAADQAIEAAVSSSALACCSVRLDKSWLPWAICALAVAMFSADSRTRVSS